MYQVKIILRLTEDASYEDAAVIGNEICNTLVDFDSRGLLKDSDYEVEEAE